MVHFKNERTYNLSTDTILNMNTIYGEPILYYIAPHGWMHGTLSRAVHYF